MIDVPIVADVEDFQSPIGVRGSGDSTRRAHRQAVLPELTRIARAAFTNWLSRLGLAGHGGCCRVTA